VPPKTTGVAGATKTKTTPTTTSKVPKGTTKKFPYAQTKKSAPPKATFTG
jgi:hypothetical protein